MFRCVGKTRVTSVLCNISYSKAYGILVNKQHPVLFTIIGYIKIEGNYCYDKYKTNLEQCKKKEEEGILLISRAKLSKAQG